MDDIILILAFDYKSLSSFEKLNNSKLRIQKKKKKKKRPVTHYRMRSHFNGSFILCHLACNFRNLLFAMSFAFVFYGKTV